MTETYNALRPYLPAEQVRGLDELRRQVLTDSRQAWEYLKDNPKSTGIPVSNFLDWIEAMPCVTFVQFVEDKKIACSEALDPNELSSLFRRADQTITSFIERYRSLESTMRPQNFINSYLESACIKLSTIDPMTQCFAIDFDPIGSDSEVDEALGDANWQQIKVFHPDLYTFIRGAAAKAKYWHQLNAPALTIVPVEILGDFLVMERLADTIQSVQNDIKQLLDSNGSQKVFHTLDSLRDEAFHDFASRLTKYNLTQVHAEMHPAALQIAKDYAGSPKEIIEQFGPGYLCVPWSPEDQKIDKQRVLDFLREQTERKERDVGQ